jgi:hypothetical protein
VSIAKFFFFFAIYIRSSFAHAHEVSCPLPASSLSFSFSCLEMSKDVRLIMKSDQAASAPFGLRSNTLASFNASACDVEERVKKKI